MSDKPQTVEDRASAVASRIARTWKLNMSFEGNAGTEIAAALRDYGDQREREAVQAAARAVCPECKRIGPPRPPRLVDLAKPYVGHGDWFHDGQGARTQADWTSQCKANAIFRAFPSHVSTPAPAKEGE